MKRYQRVLLITGVLAIVFGYIAWFQPQTYADDPAGAGMAITTRGSVTLGREKKQKRLLPMDILREGDILTVNPGGTATVVIYRTNEEYTLKGPAKVKILNTGITQSEGSIKKISTKTALALPGNSKIYSKRILGMSDIGDTLRVPLPPPPTMPVPAMKTPSIAQTIAPDVTVTPGIEPTEPVAEPTLEVPDRIIYPVPESSVLDGNVTVYWKIEPEPQKAGLLLTEMSEDPQKKDEKTVFATDVTGKKSLSCQTLLKKPLEPGKKYHLYIVYLKSSGFGQKEYKIESTFEVLPVEQANVINSYRQEYEQTLKKDPKNTAPLVKLLAAYMGHGLYAEAAYLGANAENRMSANPNFYFILAEAFEKIGLPDKQKFYENKAKELEKATEENSLK